VDVEWIYLAEDKDRWRTLVNTVMNLWVLAPQSISQKPVVAEPLGQSFPKARYIVDGQPVTLCQIKLSRETR
jgi:hypothetical protein